MYSEDMHSAVSLAALGVRKELSAASPANLSAFFFANYHVCPQICLQFYPQIGVSGCKFVSGCVALVVFFGFDSVITGKKVFPLFFQFAALCFIRTYK